MRAAIVTVAICLCFQPCVAEELIVADLNRDGIVNQQDLAVLAGEWLQTGQPYTPVTTPFPGPAPLLCTQVQRFSVPAGQRRTVIEVSDGPSVITSFWMACDFSGKARQTPIRIYFDGHETPDIEGLTGELFGCGLHQPANFRADFLGVTNSSEIGEGTETFKGFSGYLRLAMPYYTSIKIEIENTSTSNGLVWMMLERFQMDPARLHSLGVRPGMHLKTFGYGHGGNKLQHSEVTLLETSGPTILAGVFQFMDNSVAAGGGGNYRYLEGDHAIYYNGESNPSYRGSGAEDFYKSSWYFQEGPFAEGDICVPVKNASKHQLVATRFFPLWRAPAAENGLKFTWQVGEPAMSTTGNTYTRWITWYYE